MWFPEALLLFFFQFHFLPYDDCMSEDKMLALGFILEGDVINIVIFHCNGTNSFVDGQEGTVWIKLHLNT